MNTLIVLAFVAQLSDTALTCHTLKQPGGRESNPVFGSATSCKHVVVYKAASLAAIPLTRGRWRRAVLAANIGAGSVGVTVTLLRR